MATQTPAAVVECGQVQALVTAAFAHPIVQSHGSSSCVNHQPATPGAPAGLADTDTDTGSNSCVFEPQAFFVAWNGVMTLAFAGFPAPILRFKRGVTAQFGLKAEHFGSKWPKTTLGCLRDNGRTLTLDELRKLHGLCVKYGEVLRQAKKQASHQQPLQHSSHGYWSFQPSAASIAVYQCRSLERLLVRVDIPLNPHAERLGSSMDDIKQSGSSSSTGSSLSASDSQVLVPVPAISPQELQEEKQRVASVLAEFSEAALGEYLSAVNKPGNHLPHYRDDYCGTTLVCFWDSNRAAAVPVAGSASSPNADKAMAARAPSWLQAFRDEVDAVLPGYYTWFEDHSLHVTLRTIS